MSCQQDRKGTEYLKFQIALTASTANGGYSESRWWAATNSRPWLAGQLSHLREPVGLGRATELLGGICSIQQATQEDEKLFHL